MDRRRLDTGDFHGAANLLLLQQPGGTLRNVAPSNLVPLGPGGFSHGGDVADIDCDDIDILKINTTHRVPPRLLVNQDSGVSCSRTSSFRRLSGAPGVRHRFTGGGFCDIDNDGDPDLLMTGFAGYGDRLLLNDGFGNFREHARFVFPQQPTAKRVRPDCGWHAPIPTWTSSNDLFVDYAQHSGQGSYTDG